MYLDFHSLEKEPFHITPDPDFLYLSPCHKEAFASVMYGVTQRKGFIAVTGEVGTGKTTVLRAYLRELQGGSVDAIYLFNPDISFDELLDTMLKEMGPKKRGLAQANKIQQLQWHLIQAHEAGRTVVLIVDEAQNMPVDTMEKARVLSNLESATDKLLQIVFVGQPELEDKLNLHELRQLNQRIAVRSKIRPLSAEESRAYIRHRIQLAGGNPDLVFTPGAVDAIVRYARGIPRTLNIVCDNALAAGFGAQRRPVPARLAREVIRDLSGGSRLHGWNWKWAGMAAAASAALVLAASSLYVAVDARNAAHVAAQPPKIEVPAVAAETVAAPEAIPVREESEAAPVLAKADPLPAVVPEAEHVDTPPMSPVEEGAALLAKRLAEPSPLILRSPRPEPVSAPAPEAVETTTAGAEPVEMAEVAAPAPEMEAASALPAPVVDASVAQLETEANAVVRPAPPGPRRPEEFPVRRRVEKGERLFDLLREVYGAFTPDLLAQVLAANPVIEEPDKILYGTTLTFPARGAAETGPGEHEQRSAP